jgi:lysophospholipase L1-like esterase
MSHQSRKLPTSYCLAILVSFGLTACFAESDSTDVGSGGTTAATGGDSGLGGTGGTVGTGTTGGTTGTTATGGSIATGGTTATGGTVATGGTLTTGGSVTTGGTSAEVTGGRGPGGGRTGAGGSTAGGTTGIPEGGSTATGGATGMGGVGVTGGTSGDTGGRTMGGRGGGTGVTTGGTTGVTTGGTTSAGGATTGGTTGATGGGGGDCVKGTKGKDVAVIGESFIDMSTITSELEKLATAAGALPSGEHYDDNAVSGTTLANDQIPSQYRQAVKDQGAIKYVFMDGGGNDCLINNNGAAALTAAESLFKTMAEDKTEKVVYFFYPDPIGSNFTSLKTCLDSLRPQMKALCDGLAAPKCYWLDLRDTWNGHSEYTSDGIHPTSSGSKATADAIWKVAVANCVAQ